MERRKRIAATLSLHPGHPSKIREINQWRVLRALRDQQPLTRSCLAQILAISKVTASAVANGLLEQELVTETERASSGIGRKAGLLRLSPTLGSVLALDVDAQTVRSATADLRGSHYSRVEFATPRTLRELVEAITQNIQTIASRTEAPLRQVGISLPASVTRDGNLEFAGTPQYLNGSNLGALLAIELPSTPILLVNDMNAAALAEQRDGVAKTWSDFAFLGIRKSGIGMGLMLDGRIYQGRHGRAGEIGLLRLDTHFENLDAVFANDGKEALTELTTVLATAFSLLDLEGVVVHSEVQRGKPWLEELKDRLQSVVPYPIQLQPSQLEQDAALEGALAMALTDAWNQIESDVTGARSSNT